MNAWYKFNDDIVSLVTNDRDVINRDAYILFYRKRTPFDEGYCRPSESPMVAAVPASERQRPPATTTAGVRGLPVRKPRLAPALPIRSTITTVSPRPPVVRMDVPTAAMAVRGLSNIGNTGYANALLQAMASIPSLAKILTKTELRRVSEHNQASLLTRTFMNMCDELWQVDKRAADTRSFLVSIKGVCPVRKIDLYLLMIIVLTVAFVFACIERAASA